MCDTESAGSLVRSVLAVQPWQTTHSVDTASSPSSSKRLSTPRYCETQVGVVSDRTDLLWLGQILGDAEFALVKHAEKRLEESIKERRRRAEQADQETNQVA